MSRLYSELPLKPNSTAQISLVQVLSVAAIIMISFVLPSQLITLYQNSNTGQSAYALSKVTDRKTLTSISSSTATTVEQVAGVAVAKSLLRIPGTDIVINMNNSQTGIMVIAGIVLVAIALGLIVYMLVTA